MAAKPKPKKNLDRKMARCRWHVPANTSFIGWSAWAEDKSRQGHVQKKCPDCGRLYFKEEWGKPPRGRSWATAKVGRL